MIGEANYAVCCYIVSTKYIDHDESFLAHGISNQETFKVKRKVHDKRIHDFQIADCICEGVPVKWYVVLSSNKPSRSELTRSLMQLMAIAMQDYEDRIADIKMINKAMTLREKFFFSMMRMSGKGLGKVSQSKEKYTLYVKMLTG